MGICQFCKPLTEHKQEIEEVEVKSFSIKRLETESF